MLRVQTVHSPDHGEYQRQSDNLAGGRGSIRSQVRLRLRVQGRTFILKRKSLKFILDVMDAFYGV